MITTHAAGCKETVEEGVNEYLVPLKDTQGLIYAFNAFLSLTHEQQDAMGLAGREKAVEEFDNQKIAQEIFTLVRSQL